MSRRTPTGMWRSRLGIRSIHLLAALMLSAFTSPALAQHAIAWVPAQGHGSLSVAYQHLYVRYHVGSHGQRAIPGTIRDRSVFLGLDYGLTDRFALTVGGAFKSNRYDGLPHAHVDDDHGEHFIDDGLYHGGWADWSVGLRYQWRSDPWAVTPYVSYGTPIRDYPTFAHSAVGTGQKRAELGLNVGHRFGPPSQNLYVQGGYGYSFMEVVDHRRVNHSTLSLELGYFLSPRFTARITVIGQKTHNGLDFPKDYPTDPDTGQPLGDDHFFHHDQNVRDDFVNVGAGVDYQFTERYVGFANIGRTVWGENTHLIDYALTVGISGGF
jgi:hypothetical protein